MYRERSRERDSGVDPEITGKLFIRGLSFDVRFSKPIDGRDSPDSNFI